MDAFELQSEDFFVSPDFIGFLSDKVTGSDTNIDGRLDLLSFGTESSVLKADYGFSYEYLTILSHVDTVAGLEGVVNKVVTSISKVYEKVKILVAKLILSGHSFLQDVEKKAKELLIKINDGKAMLQELDDNDQKELNSGLGAMVAYVTGKTNGSVDLVSLQSPISTYINNVDNIYTDTAKKMDKLMNSGIEYLSKDRKEDTRQTLDLFKKEVIALGDTRLRKIIEVESASGLSTYGLIGVVGDKVSYAITNISDNRDPSDSDSTSEAAFTVERRDAKVDTEFVFKTANKDGLKKILQGVISSASRGGRILDNIKKELDSSSASALSIIKRRETYEKSSSGSLGATMYKAAAKYSDVAVLKVPGIYLKTFLYTNKMLYVYAKKVIGE